MKKHILLSLLLAVAGIAFAADSIDTMVRKITGSNTPPTSTGSNLTAFAIQDKSNNVVINGYDGTAKFQTGITASGTVANNLSGSTGAFTFPTADATLPPPANGGNLGASNVFTGGINIALVPFATMTNGSTETTSWMDDTPAAEFSAVTVGTAPTDTQDATIARIGTNSLKLAWPAASVAGDGVTASLTSDNLEANESVGFWIYSTDVLADGDLTLVLTDNGGDRTFNVPAVATRAKWTWVEVDVSSLAAGTGDAITAYKFLLSSAGATAHAAFDTYIDGVWKWDSADELALGVDVLDQPGAIRSILTQVKADAGTQAHDMAALVENTDFFVHRESGNDFLVQITNQSTKSGFGLVLHK
jgi:hypothetical protein